MWRNVFCVTFLTETVLQMNWQVSCLIFIEPNFAEWNNFSETLFNRRVYRKCCFESQYLKCIQNENEKFFRDTRSRRDWYFASKIYTIKIFRRTNLCMEVPFHRAKPGNKAENVCLGCLSKVDFDLKNLHRSTKI